jgi:hypothetical protein
MFLHHPVKKFMDKKTYEHIFKTKFDAQLDDWSGDATGDAIETLRAGRVGLIIKNPPPETLMITEPVGLFIFTFPDDY